MKNDDENPKDTIKRIMSGAGGKTNVADFVAEARKRGREVASPPPQPITIQITGNATVGIVGVNTHIEIKVCSLSGDLSADELGEVIRQFSP